MVLRRNVDTGGADFFRGRFGTFEVTRVGMLRELFHSAEFTALATSELERSRRVYQALFLRDPDVGGEAYWATRTLDEQLTAFLDDPEFSRSQPAAVFQGCSAARLDAAVNSGHNVAAFLAEDCIRYALPASTLELPAGRYTLRGVLVIKPIRGALTIRTRGRTATTRCDNAPACAEFHAAADFSLTEWVAMVMANDVTLDGLIFDGNKDARRALWLGAGGTEDIFGGGVSITPTSADPVHRTTIRHCVVKDMMRATALNPQIVEGMTLEDTLVTGSGWHEADAARSWWADGVTFNSASDSIIRNNEVVDATDVALIFGACPRCDISGNVIRHTGPYISASWAGLAIQAWPYTSGNYAETTVNGNMVDCGTERRCGYGILVGNESWSGFPGLAGGTLAFGFTMDGNTVRNAVVGVQVDQATGTFGMSNTSVTNSGGRYRYCSNADGAFCQWLWSEPINVSPYSLPFLNADTGITDAVFSMTSYDEFLPMEPARDNALDAQPVNLSSVPTTGATPPGALAQPSSNEHRVRLMYRLLFGREADSGGLAFNTGRLDSGMTIPAMAMEFINSQEFADRHAPYTASADRVVPLMYQLLFGRVADRGGHDFWVGAIIDGTQTRAAFFDAMVNNAEFTGRF